MSSSEYDLDWYDLKNNRVLKPYVRGDLEREGERRKARHRALLKQGYSVREIAAMGTSFMRQRRHQRDETIRDLHGQGRTQQQIADELGVSKTTVNNAIHYAVLTYKNG